uniref:Uncharacterized protein n=1 Tax=Arundo donax TaxID=35708 RepID=A0A0A9C2U4_ARUDO
MVKRVQHLFCVGQLRRRAANRVADEEPGLVEVRRLVAIGAMAGTEEEHAGGVDRRDVGVAAAGWSRVG